MATVAESRTPMHLWIVGVVSLLWNSFGAYDYTMTRMRDADYIASMMPGVDPNAIFAWVDSFPLWAQTAWALGVWGSFVGSILLLLRNRWAVWSFGISLLGAVLSFGYQLGGANPMPGDPGTMGTIMPIVIILIVIALFAYSRAMEKKGVLH